MAESRHGFYEFAPEEPFDPDEVVRFVKHARRHVGDIDMVVLPEGALDERELQPLQQRLTEVDVPDLIAGVRQPSSADVGFGGNYAHFGAVGWQAPPQHKHHR
jgi:hypothetical protein